jgi:hypothetical protein
MNENSQSHVRPVTDIQSAAGHQNHSLAGLVRQLTHDITSLFTKELALAKVEVSHSIQDAKAGAVSLVSGGSVLYAGFLFLLLAGVLALGQVVELWMASLIIGGAVTVVGMIMVASGKKKMKASSFKPEHTLAAMEKDKQAMRGSI